MENNNQNKRILVAYFSWSGNTKRIANQIHKLVSDDSSSVEMFEIVPVKPYSTDYNICIDEAKKEKQAQARPALKNSVQDTTQYDIIILGYPNWWSTIPMPVAAFMESSDFSGKTIIPFCTHGSGGLGQSLKDIERLAPNSKIEEAFSVNSSGGSSLLNDLTAWLRRLGLAK